MNKKKKIEVKCPNCGCTKFHLEDTNNYVRCITSIYPKEGGGFTVELAERERNDSDWFNVFCSNNDCKAGPLGVSKDSQTEALIDFSEELELVPVGKAAGFMREKE